MHDTQHEGPARPAIDRILLVPRWSGTAASDCYPWLSRELAARAPGLSLEVVPLLPAPDRPEIEPCVAACVAALGAAEAARTVLVGHSVGCQVAMRALARLPDGVRVSALLGIAGWWTVDRPWETLRPWIETPFDHGRAAARCGRALVLLSDDDPYTSDCAETARRFEAALRAEIEIVPGRRHFNAPEEPEVMDALIRLAGMRR
ncbi:MAG TPA: alpha/beta hydrolase [Kofleriaceae bacterium]|nr:alpha/beta hydrolase [Kofleriaceae bacterium]